MAGCCHHDSGLDAQQAAQRRILKQVLFINVLMFFAVASAALVAGSSSLLSDSLDNLGDALTYALSIFAVTKGAQLKAKIALFKGFLIFAAACAVVVQIVYKLLNPLVPIFELMGVFSIIGVIANGTCVYLLTRYKDDDVNMNSVWECAKNDIATNLSVLIAAAGVWYFEAGWPDIAIAMILVCLLLSSALRVIRSALKELKCQSQ